MDLQNKYRRNAISVACASAVGAMACVITYRHYFDETWYGYTVSIFIGMLIAAIAVGPKEFFDVIKDSARFIMEVWEQRSRARLVLEYIGKVSVPLVKGWKSFWRALSKGILIIGKILLVGAAIWVPFGIESAVRGEPAITVALAMGALLSIAGVVGSDHVFPQHIIQSWDWILGRINGGRQVSDGKRRSILPSLFLVALWPLLVMESLIRMIIVLSIFTSNIFLKLATTPRMAAMIGAAIGGMAGIGFDLNLASTAGVAVFIGLLAFKMRKVCDRKYGDGALIPI